MFDRDVVKEALRRLRLDFPHKSKSWLQRCLRRLKDVRKLKVGYAVRGRAELGDEETMYFVDYDEESKRWRCTCYDPVKMWSQRRRVEVCTHVGAVLLYRHCWDVVNEKRARLA